MAEPRRGSFHRKRCSQAIALSLGVGMWVGPGRELVDPAVGMAVDNPGKAIFSSHILWRYEVRAGLYNWLGRKGD
jgi:hypothetical protein